MDAKCQECEQVAKTDDDLTKVICQHCNFESTYDEYIEIMKNKAINMATDYIPDRPGF